MQRCTNNFDVQIQKSLLNQSLRKMYFLKSYTCKINCFLQKLGTKTLNKAMSYFFFSNRFPLENIESLEFWALKR